MKDLAPFSYQKDSLEEKLTQLSLGKNLEDTSF